METTLFAPCPSVVDDRFHFVHHRNIDYAATEE